VIIAPVFLRYLFVLNNFVVYMKASERFSKLIIIGEQKNVDNSVLTKLKNLYSP